MSARDPQLAIRRKYLRVGTNSRISSALPKLVPLKSVVALRHIRVFAAAKVVLETMVHHLDNAVP